ncbi:MAG: hypothetical protein M3Y80_10960 [Verrucomicrobiota bacterium]|nr:hypothetical protein [Verrucomicrobiota bacterium]
MTSALRAGWICFGLGLLMAWFFPFGHVFFSIAIITAIVAMCTHQVDRGLALLLASFVGVVVCAAIFITLVVGAIGAAAAPIVRESNLQRKRSEEAQAKMAEQFTAASARAAQSFAAANRQMQEAQHASAARAERESQYQSALLRAAEVRRMATEEAQRAYDREKAERQRNQQATR